MIFYLFFQKKLFFLQQSLDPLFIKEGNILAANIAIVPKIEPPFC